MVKPQPTTLLVTFRREDRVQGNIGRGLREILDEDVVVAQYDELEFILSSGNIEVRIDEYEIRDFDKVIMYGAVGRNLRVAHPLALILRAANMRAFTSGAENYDGLDKLTQNVVFALTDVPIPKTYYASPQNILESAESVIGFPMIVKDILSSQGERNYLIHSQEELAALSKDLGQDRYIAQEYIENTGDVRILVNAKHETLALKRVAAAGSHLNNTSAGGTAKQYDNPPQKMIEYAKTIIDERGAPLLGIDVIENGEDLYFLEANIQPMMFSGELTEKKRQWFKSTLDELV